MYHVRSTAHKLTSLATAPLASASSNLARIGPSLACGIPRLLRSVRTRSPTVLYTATSVSTALVRTCTSEDDGKSGDDGRGDDDDERGRDDGRDEVGAKEEDD